MLALAIVVSSLVLIALLRFGIIVRYGENGFDLWVKAAFLKFHIIGESVKKKPKKKKEKKEKPKKPKPSFKEIAPGLLSEFMNILRAVQNTLHRVKRRLLIKQLTLYYTSAGEDPASTALMFGGANAVFGALIPALKKNFRVRRLDLRTWFDFNSTEQKIYAKIIISIAVWEVFYIVFALFPLIASIFKMRPKKTKSTSTVAENDRKDGQDNGETADQRFDGNNDAKNEGND